MNLIRCTLEQLNMIVPLIKKYLLLTGICLICFTFSVFSQNKSAAINTNGSSALTTAAPFLLIAPDARGGAMGDNGAATSGDVNSMHWNPAKYAFAPGDNAIGISYTPWLRRLTNDINLGYVSGYKKLDQNQTLAGSFRYFSYGDIIYTDEQGNNYGQVTPSEFSVDLAYIRKLTDNFSIALAGRFIHSNIGQSSSDNSLMPGNAGAADIAIYYKKDGRLFGTNTTTSYGVNISNIGTKMDYGTGNKSFLPTNLRIGAGENFHLDESSSFAVNLDVNKLLVPTNPIRDQNGNIVKGMNPNVSVPAGIFQSFYDAPGGGKEELQELSYALGMEYNYNQQFFLRSGYFYENPNKGNRRYLTLGAGVKFNIFNLDFSYLVSQKQNPLSNTLRFSLNFYFGNKISGDAGHEEK